MLGAMSFTRKYEPRLACLKWVFITIGIAAGLLVVPVSSAVARTFEVEVQLLGLRSSQGQILVAAHEDRSTFPSQWDRAVAFARAKSTAPSVTVTLKLPKPGRYALIAVHDEDGNGTMTKNVIGLPREGYTVGNNPSTLEFPRFDRALLEFREPRRIELSVLYP